jgi:hypothetical protein
VVVVIPEGTPNPSAIKFTLDRPAVDGGSATLGAAIFALGGVTNVFMVSNFVSVTKVADASWDDLAPGIVSAIEAHFAE